MTGPNTNSDQFSSTTPLFQSEWDSALERRRQLVDEITKRLGLATQLGSSVVADTVANAHQFWGKNEDGSPTTYQQATANPNQHELNQLLGAAQYYGIDNADKIPPIRLKQIVDARRLAAQPESNDRNVLEKTGQTIAESTIALGLGTMQELVNVAQRLPFVGDAIARTKAVQGADQYLSQVNEAMVSNMTSEEASGFRTATRIGGMVGYALPASGAWKVAGAAGKIGFVARAGARLSPWMRAAVQGAASTALLETGGDESNEEKMMKVGMGAVGGAAFHFLEGAVPRLFERVRGSFRTTSDPFYGQDYNPVVPPGESPAEWWYEGDHQIGAPPRQLGAGEPTLGSTEPPAEGGGGGGTSVGFPVGPVTGNEFAFTGTIVPPQGQLPGIPRLPPAPTDVPFDVISQTAQLPAGAAALPSGQPAALGAPAQPAGLLMSPERAAMQDRLNGLVEQRDIARRLSETDALTGFGNKAALEHARSVVDADPQLSWAVFDGKQFKAVNDHFGHDYGDGILANFAKSMNQAAQEMNLPARFFRQGGDEFAAAVPADQAEAFASRVKELSYQRISHPAAGTIETRLDSYTSGSFADADLSLMANKRAATLGTEAAAIEGNNISKQATLMESADSRTLASASELSNTDVVAAQMNKNPGGIQIVRGVGDASKTVRSLVQAQQEQRLMPHTFRFVERNGSLDLLVSDGLPVTNKRVGQYKEHGFFEGQSATVNGAQVIISKPGLEVTEVQDPMKPDQTFKVRTRDVLPGNSTDVAAHISEVYPKAPELYDKFQAYVMQQMERGGQAMGVAEPFDWLGHETSTQLPRMLDEFLDSKGIQNPAFRNAVEGYFNVRRTADYRALVPAESKQLGSVVRELDIAANVKPPVALPIEDIAATKGFDYVASAGEDGGTLVDRLSDLRVPVEHPEAAHEFLRSFNREVPDYSPLSEVPIELSNAGPHAANPGDDLEPIFQGGEEQIHAATVRQLGHVERHVEAANNPRNLIDTFTPRREPVPPGGGFSPPPPPPPPSFIGGLPGDRGFGQLPPVKRSLGAAFEKVRKERPAELYRVLQQLDSAWLNYGEPFRRVTIKIQNDLQAIGVDEGVLWKHYSDLVTAVSKKHNEEHPWMSEASDIFSNFHRKLLRDGTVTRIQEISDFNQKMAAMQRAGYTEREIAAQRRLSDFNDRFFSYMVDSPEINLDYSRYVFGYMSRVRMRQGMPGVADPYADTEGMLPREFQFFAEMARTGNLQMRQMDARVLTTTMIRAAMFKKFAAAPWENMVRAWDDPRVPSQLRDLVTGWLQVVKTGHNPEYDVAVQGIRHTLNKIGVPVTDGEVASIWNSAFSNMYRARLGYRPDVVFRDAIQPLMAGTRIGFKPIADSYNRFLTGGAERDAMWQRAFHGGWVEQGQVRVPIAEVFEGQIQSPEGQSLLPAHLQARREKMATVGDYLYDLLPRSARNGIQGTKLDPLLMYTKLGELNRLISGDAGWQVATKALADYQFEIGRLHRGEMQLGSGQMIVDKQDALLKQLMDKSQADVYPKPIRDEFQRLVSEQDIDGAANLLANEAANSQFRYGSKENPIGIRKAGTTGRAGMMFGSFTQQYIAGMREQFAADIPTVKRAAMAARHGTVNAILGLAGAYTGWKFSKWMWHQSLTFAGGPLATGLYEAVQSVTGRIAEATNQPLTPQQMDALARSRRTSVAQDLAGAAAGVFPYTSGIQTVSRLATAATGLNPIEATTRAVITGDRGLSSDFRQFFDRQQTVTPVDLNLAVQGQREAIAKFSPEELGFIQGTLSRVPPEQRYQVWAGWRSSRVDKTRPYPSSLGGGAGAR